jgi:Terpene synthase family 2, C-terminal metal binding
VGNSRADLCIIDQLAWFLDEMVLFVEMSQAEQEYHLGDRIPTIQEYWVCRMGTIGAGPSMAMVEYVELA